MTYHNVLPQLGNLFPRFALIFNILIKRTICAYVKSYEFLHCSDHVRLCVWHPFCIIYPRCFSRHTTVNELYASNGTKENHQLSQTIPLPYSSRTVQACAYIICHFCSQPSKSVKIADNTPNCTRTYVTLQKCTIY